MGSRTSLFFGSAFIQFHQLKPHSPSCASCSECPSLSPYTLLPLSPARWPAHAPLSLYRPSSPITCSLASPSPTIPSNLLVNPHVQVSRRPLIPSYLSHLLVGLCDPHHVTTQHAYPSHLLVGPHVPCQETVYGALRLVAPAVYGRAVAEGHQRLAGRHGDSNTQLTKVVGEVAQLFSVSVAGAVHL